MRILVTGATGFVGANLVKNLFEKNTHEVYITARRQSNFWRIQDIKDDLKVVQLDLSNRDEVFTIIEKIKPKIIYHIATYGGFTNQTDCDQIIKSNLYSTINLLDAAIENEVGQFINTGSSSEYGIKDYSMKESDLCEPINLYGITKLAATNYCSMIGKTKNYRVCTLRLFSPYGPYENSSRLYPSIVNALKEGISPKLSRPNSVRDFIEVEKVVEVYTKIIEANYRNGEIINVGSGQQKTIEEFYNIMAQKMNVDIEPVWGEAPPRAFEPLCWQADINRLKTLIDIEW